MLLLAAASSKDDLIDMLKKEIQEYDTATGKAKDEAWDKLQLTCVVVMSKRIVPSIDDVARVSKEMKAKKAMMDVLDSNNQNNMN